MEQPFTDIAASNRVLAVLKQLDIDFEVINCDPALADTQRFCEHYGYPLANSANVIIAVGKSEPRQFAACVLLATTRLNINRCVRKRFGVRRASFASPEETRKLTGMDIGGITALGLPESLPVWVDHQVMEMDYIILGGGSRSIKLKLAPEVFRQIQNIAIVEELVIIPD